MVYRSACPSYPTIINAAKDCDTERGSGDHDEIGGITIRRIYGRNEPDSSAVGQFDAPTARYQKGQGRS